jgi:hypothetical protein
MRSTRSSQLQYIDWCGACIFSSGDHVEHGQEVGAVHADVGGFMELPLT